MRSIKIALLLAVTAMLAAAFAIPAVASASSWTKGGEVLQPKSELVWSQDGAPFEGSGLGLLAFEGSTPEGAHLIIETERGKFNCGYLVYAILNPNGGAGEFVTSGAGCEVSGYWKSRCGSNVTEIEPVEEFQDIRAVWWAGKPAFKVEDFDVIYHLQCEGGDLPIEFSGDLIFTPSDPSLIEDVDVTGIVDVSLEGEVQEQALVSSTDMHTSWESGFGIGTAWLEGTIGWTNGSGGSAACPVKGSVVLLAGSEGELTSLNWDGAGCTLEGSMASSCGVHGIESVVSDNLPWALENDGESLKLGEASFTVEAAGSCSEKGTWKGKLTPTPNNKSAISSMSLIGTLSGPGAAKRNLLGSLKWDPEGVFGF